MDKSEIMSAPNKTNVMTATIKHLSNLTSYLSDNEENLEIIKLQTHYLQLQRTLSGLLEMPKKQFEPAKMCSYCSTMWRPDNCKVRVCAKTSRKKRRTQTKITDSTSNKRLSKQGQTVQIKCSNCNKLTIVPARKKLKRKVIKEDKQKTPPTLKKKKKSKPKDKFCNLNISAISLNSPLLKHCVTPKNEAASVPKKKAIKQKQPLKLTPVQKISKINKMKLENVLNNSSTKKRKSALGLFLNELF